LITLIGWIPLDQPALAGWRAFRHSSPSALAQEVEHRPYPIANENTRITLIHPESPRHPVTPSPRHPVTRRRSRNEASSQTYLDYLDSPGSILSPCHLATAGSPTHPCRGPHRAKVAMFAKPSGPFRSISVTPWRPLRPSREPVSVPSKLSRARICTDSPNRSSTLPFLYSSSGTNQFRPPPGGVLLPSSFNPQPSLDHFDHLDSLGFTRIHSDSLGFTRVHSGSR
jgi:hypothetical protein